VRSGALLNENPMWARPKPRAKSVSPNVGASWRFEIAGSMAQKPAARQFGGFLVARGYYLEGTTGIQIDMRHTGLDHASRALGLQGFIGRPSKPYRP